MSTIRRALGITKSISPPTLKYCSKECRNKSRMTGEYLKCKECGEEVYRAKRELEKNDSVFCGHSCKAIFWNKNKNFGSNRSKIEIWIEDELKRVFDFEISFNDRNLLSKYELDIYIPTLNLAFELNGIFHYQPIFGNDRLKIVKKNDIEKINECYIKGVELFVIDITDSKRFNKDKDKKYLDFIINEINKRNLI